MTMINFSIRTKYHQLGIFKAMGFNNSELSKLFTIQTLLISIPSLLIGLLTGTLSVYLYRKLMVYPDGRNRFELIINPVNYLYSIITILVIILLANIFTTIKIKRK